MDLKKLEYGYLNKGDSILIMHRSKKPSLGRIAGFFPECGALSVDIQFGPNPDETYNRRLGSAELANLLVFQGQTIMAGERAYSFLDKRNYPQFEKDKHKRSPCKRRSSVDYNLDNFDDRTGLSWHEF
jgi:hypothetical protein